MSPASGTAELALWCVSRPSEHRKHNCKPRAGSLKPSDPLLLTMPVGHCQAIDSGHSWNRCFLRAQHGTSFLTPDIGTEIPRFLTGDRDQGTNAVANPIYTRLQRPEGAEIHDVSTITNLGVLSPVSQRAIPLHHRHARSA